MTAGVFDLTVTVNSLRDSPCRPATRRRVTVRSFQHEAHRRPEPQRRLGQDDPRDQPGELLCLTPATPVLMDFDPQGSSMRWVKKRQPTQPPIHVIAAFEKDSRTTRAFQLRVPEERHMSSSTRRPRSNRARCRKSPRSRQDPRAGAALGHRHPHLLTRHPRPAAGGEDPPRGRPHRGDRQSHPAQYPHLSVADPVSADARHSHRRDHPRLAELRPRRGAWHRRARDEELHRAGGRRAVAAAGGVAGALARRSRPESPPQSAPPPPVTVDATTTS